MGGDPLKNAKLTLDGVIKATLTPQRNGQYTTPLLPAGTYTITPVLPAYSFTPSSRIVVLSGTSLSGGSFVGAPVVPMVTAIDPKRGAPGEVVKISGTGFGPEDTATSKVKFGEAEALSEQWTNDTIRAIVPSIDAAVSVTVKTAGGVSIPVPFAYKAPGKLNVYPKVSSSSKIGLLALNFVQHAASPATRESVTQES